MQVITKFEHCYIAESDFLCKEDYQKAERKLKEINDKRNTNFLFTSQGIKLNQYVGLIGFDKDKYIEILPKIYDDGSCGKNLPDSAIREGRKILTKLLMVYLGIDPKDVDLVNLNYGEYPILDIFIDIFTREVSKIVKQGLKKKYVRVRKNSKYLKGRLLVLENIRRNRFNQAKFFVDYEELSTDIAENRILKTTLSYLRKHAKQPVLRKKITNLLFDFDEVSFSSNVAKDLQNIHVDRTFLHYDYALRLAKIFLSGYSFSSVIQESDKKEEMISLLFDMNELFEKYVAFVLKTKYNLPIETQETQKSNLYLAYDYNSKSRIFKLKPDMYLETNNKICILDTKWKKISNERGNDNYGISPQDMYQVLAYAVRYRKVKNKPVEVYLIYPKYEKFSHPLMFSIETPRENEKVFITAIPFDLEEDSLINVEDREFSRMLRS